MVFYTASIISFILNHTNFSKDKRRNYTMNTLEDALKRAGIEASDFEDVKVDENEIKRNLEIEFLEQWLKLAERGASDKEKHLFAIKHGFVSENHLNLYLSVTGDIGDLEYEIEECSEFLTSEQLKSKKNELKEKRSMAANIKEPWYYRHIMSQLKRKDVSPYGLDVVRNRPFAATQKERLRQAFMSL